MQANKNIDNYGANKLFPFNLLKGDLFAERHAPCQ